MWGAGKDNKAIGEFITPTQQEEVIKKE